MKRRISLFAAALAAVTAVTAATGAAVTAAMPANAADAGTASGQREVPLPGSAAPFAGHATMLAAVPGARQLTIQLWLRPRTAAAERYADAVSTPGNRMFRHYLSPAAYTARFGPTARQVRAAGAWLRSAGFSRVAPDAGRDYVRATAPVPVIEHALRTRLRYYRPADGTNAGTHQLRGNDGPVSLPAALARHVLGVTGLENAAPVMTYLRPGGKNGGTRVPRAGAASFPCSSYYGQHYARGLPRKYKTTRFPTEACGYTAIRLRMAYRLAARDAGAGQTVALVEVGLAPDMFLTLRDYARASHLRAPARGRYRQVPIGGGSRCGDPFNIEEQLDVEAAYAMAPASKQVVVGGDSCDNGDAGLQALFDADTRILNGRGGRPLASIASNSWEGNDETQPAGYTSIEHAYLLRAAAEGVGMYFSSGDGSGVLTPSSDPYAVAVGGSTLGVGRRDMHLFETGWSTGGFEAVNGKWAAEGEQGAAGGGQSVLWRQPAYQHAVVPARLARAPGNRGGPVRAVPDIAADADPFTGFAEGMLSFDSGGAPTGYSESAIGGTSLAAPLVSGIVADAQQGQRAPFGFLDPLLYRLAGTRALFDTRPVTGRTPARRRGVACDSSACGVLTLTQFDDQSAGMSGYTGQVTAKGYDTMTGLGTPRGQRFIAALRRAARRR